MLEAARNAAVNGTAAARGNVQLVHPRGLRIFAHLGFDDRFLEYFAWVQPETPSSCGPAHARAQRVVIADVLTHPIFAGTPALEVMDGACARACQSTPLVSRSGEVLGNDRPYRAARGLLARRRQLLAASVPSAAP